MNLSFHNSASSLASIGSVGTGAGINSCNVLYVPSNKESAWVYPKGADVIQDNSKTHQGIWQGKQQTLSVAVSSLKKRLTAKRKGDNNDDDDDDAAEEVWIFRKDDPQGIEPRVLEEHPVHGTWGYAPAVKKKKRGDKVIILQKTIDPLDMWFYPPHTKAGDIPSNCTIMGTWIKPTLQQPKKSNNLDKSGAKKWSVFGGNNNSNKEAGKERRKIIPGKKKKGKDEATVEEKPNVEPAEEIVVVSAGETGSEDSAPVVPKTPSKEAKDKAPKKYSVKSLAEDSTKKKKKKKTVKNESSDLKPPITPGKKSKTKPSSAATLESSMSSIHTPTASGKKKSNSALDSSISSIQTPTASGKKKSTTAMDSSMSSLQTPRACSNKKSAVTMDSSTSSIQTSTTGSKRRSSDHPPSTSPASLQSSFSSLASSKRSLGSDDFQIIIRRQPTLETFPLIVQPSYKILQVKQKINRSRGIPLDEIKLSHNDEPLDKVGPKETLYSLGIRNRDIVDLAGFTVYIRTLKGKKYVLSNIDVELPIEKLRDMAAEKDKTPVEKIGLYFNRQVLQNGTPLSRYKVKSKSIIELKYDSAGMTAAQQKVYTRRADVPRKRVGPSSQPPNKKPSISLKKALVVAPPETVEVTIVPAEGDQSPMTLVLDAKDGAEALLRKAAQKVGCVESDLVLTHTEGSKVVNESYKVTAGDTLNVAPVVTIQLPDHSFVKTTVLPGQNKIEDIKRQLFESNDIPIETQLLLADDDMEMGEDSALSTNMFLKLQVKLTPKKISIRGPDDEIQTITLAHDETSLDLWNKVAKMLDIPVDELCLAMDDTEEEIDYVDYTPIDGDALTVVEPPSTITVTLPNGDKFELEVMPTATIAELKEVLEEETGTTQDQHRLFPLDSDSELSDDLQLFEDMDLRLELKPFAETSGIKVQNEPTTERCVTIRKPDGQIVAINFEEESSAMEVRKQIADQIGVPIQELQLSKDGVEELKKSYVPVDGETIKMMTPRLALRMPEGNILHFDILPDDSTILLRSRIAQKTGIPEQELAIFKGDKKLDEGYVPSHGDELRLKPRKINVLSLEGTFFQVTINTGDTAETVRRKISDETNIPLKDVVLSKDEERLVGDYMPSSGDVLKLVPASVIVKLPDGTVLEPPTRSNSTVAAMKEYIEQRQGIKKSQILFLDIEGNELKDDIPVGRDAEFSIKLKKNEITIILSDEAEFKLEIDLGLTVDKLREIVSSRIGKEPQDFRVSIADEQLSSSFVLSDGDVVVVEPPNVVIKMPNGELLELAASNDTTIADVKEVLLEETGATTQDLKLYMEGSQDELEDDMAVKRDIKLRLEIHHGRKTAEPFTIIVESPDEQSHHVELLPEDSLLEMKRKIARLVGIPIKDLRLTKEEEEIKDSYVPSKGDVIYILAPTVTVELPDLELLELEALPDTTIGDIKDALEEETGIKKSKQHIFKSSDSGNVALSDDIRITADLNVKLEESITIMVRDLNGNPIEFEIAPRTDMKELRSQVATKLGVQAKGLRLSDGSDDVKACDFSGGETLSVLPPRVNVQYPDGTRKEFPVLPTQTILDLKNLIGKKSGMASESQQIFFFKKDDELDDNVTFSRSDFVDKTLLQVRYVKPQVTVLLPDGRKLSMDLEYSDTKNDVRFKVAREMGGGIAAQDLRLLIDGAEIDKRYKPKNGQVLLVQACAVKVHLPDGSRISITVIPTQTIADIKDMVEQMTGIPMDALSIFLSDRSLQLEEDAPVSRYDFDNATILEVRSPDGSPEVEVKLPDGNSFQLTIDPEKTLPQLTETIVEQFGLSIGSIWLNGELLEAPDDESLISFLGTSIRKDSVLRIDPPQITVDIPEKEKRICLRLLPSMSVGDLKKSLFQEYPDVSASIEDFVFVCSQSGEPLHDKTSVKNIDLHSVLTVAESQQEFDLHLERVGMKTLLVNVVPTDDVDDLKEKISSMTLISPEHQCLTYNGATLQEGKTLRDQGLRKGCSICLEPMRLIVQLPEGTELELAVKPQFDFGRIKDLISKQTELSTDSQILLFEGKVLNDKTLVSDSDVCSGDRLLLEIFSVSVLCWSGEVIELNGIGTRSTMDDVMKVVFKSKGVPKKKQRITKGGQNLSNLSEKTLKSLKVQHKDLFMLDNPEKLNITATPTKKTGAPFSFLQKATSLLSSPKVHVSEEVVCTEEKEASESSECEEASESSSKEDDHTFMITVITPDITPISIELSVNDSVSEVYGKISDKVGVSKEHLRLSKHGHDSILDADFFPSEGDILAVEPPTIKVSVADGSTFEVSAMSETTVIDVKKYLYEQTGTPIDELVLSDESNEQLPDDFLITKDTNLFLKKAALSNNGSESDSDDESEELKVEASSSVTIALADGKMLSIEIDGSDLARDVRKKVAKKIGIPVKDLRLSKDGRAIDKKYLPLPGEKLDIMPPDLHITLPNGSKLTMPAALSTTIDDVKAFLVKETGTAASEQELYYFGLNGKELLTEIPCSNEDIDLKLQVLTKKQPSQITIRTPDEETFVLDLKESDTAKDVRKRIAREAGFSTKGLRLTMNGLEVNTKYLPAHGDVLTVEPPVVVIEFMDGETMELEAMPGTTIEDIKDILEEEMGILKANQKLISMELNGKEWEDDRSITKDVRFRLLEFEEEELYDEVTVEDTSDDESSEEEADLVHLDDGSPLRSPRPKLGCIEIHVVEPKGGYKHTFELKVETTIDDIQIKIPHHARVAENIEDQIITFGGKALDNSLSLAECNVQSGDMLSLERYFVNISHFGMEVTPFHDISCYDTVGALKGKLVKQQSLSKDQQLLTIQESGKVLDDNYKTLKQCGVGYGATLVLQEDMRSPNTKSKARVEMESTEDDGDDETSRNLDERLAKIKERAEARKRAKAGGKRY